MVREHRNKLQALPVVDQVTAPDALQNERRS